MTTLAKPVSSNNRRVFDRDGNYTQAATGMYATCDVCGETFHVRDTRTLDVDDSSTTTLCLDCGAKLDAKLAKIDATKPGPHFAGFVSTKRNRYDGRNGWLTVYRSHEAGIESDDDPELRYSVVCETHSTVVCVGTIRAARTVCSLDFCDDCRELDEAKGTA